MYVECKIPKYLNTLVLLSFIILSFAFRTIMSAGSVKPKPNAIVAGLSDTPKASVCGVSKNGMIYVFWFLLRYFYTYLSIDVVGSDTPLSFEKNGMLPCLCTVGLKNHRSFVHIYLYVVCAPSTSSTLKGSVNSLLTTPPIVHSASGASSLSGAVPTLVSSNAVPSVVPIVSVPVKALLLDPKVCCFINVSFCIKKISCFRYLSSIMHSPLVYNLKRFTHPFLFKEVKSPTIVNNLRNESKSPLSAVDEKEALMVCFFLLCFRLFSYAIPFKQAIKREYEEDKNSDMASVLLDLGKSEKSSPPSRLSGKRPLPTIDEDDGLDDVVSFILICFYKSLFSLTWGKLSDISSIVSNDANDSDSNFNEGGYSQFDDCYRWDDDDERYSFEGSSASSMPPPKKSRYHQDNLWELMMNTPPVDNSPVISSANSLPRLTMGDDLLPPNTPLFCARPRMYCLTLKKTLPFVNRDFMKSYLAKHKLPMANKIVTYKGAIRIEVESAAEYDELFRHKWGFGVVYCPVDYDPLFNGDAFYRLIFSSNDIKDPELIARAYQYFSVRGIDVSSITPSQSGLLLVLYVNSLRDFVFTANLRENKGCLIIPNGMFLALVYFLLSLFYLAGPDKAPFVLSPILSLATTNDCTVVKLAINGLPLHVVDFELMEAIKMVAIDNSFDPDDVYVLTTFRKKGNYKSSSGFVLVRGENFAKVLIGSQIRTPKSVVSFSLEEYLLECCVLFLFMIVCLTQYSGKVRKEWGTPTYTNQYHYTYLTCNASFYSVLSFDIKLPLLLYLDSFVSHFRNLYIVFLMQFYFIKEIFSVLLIDICFALVSCLIYYIIFECPLFLSYPITPCSKSSSNSILINKIVEDNEVGNSYQNSNNFIDNINAPTDLNNLNQDNGNDSDGSDSDTESYVSNSDFSSSSDSSSDSDSVDSEDTEFASDLDLSFHEECEEMEESDSLNIIKNDLLSEGSDDCTDSSSETEEYEKVEKAILKKENREMVIASINARGAFYSHLYLFVEKMKFLNIDMLLVQDTGVVKSTYILNKEGYTIHHTTSLPGDKAGALAIVIRSTLNAFFSITKPTDKLADSLPFTINSRLMHGVLSYPVQLNIINAYAKRSLAENFEKIGSLPNLIVAGDLNSYLSAFLDSFSSKTTTKRKPKPLEKMINNGLIDVFRFLNPGKRKFTRFGLQNDKKTNLKHISASRIDYFLAGKDIVDQIAGISIHDNSVIDISDHLMITLTIYSKKIPIALLQDSYFVKKDIKNKEKWSSEFKESTLKEVAGVFPHWEDLTITTNEDAEFVADEVTSIMSKASVNTFPSEIVVPKKPPYFAYAPSLEMREMLRARKKLTGAIRFMYRSSRNKKFILDEKIVSVVELVNSKYCNKDMFKINLEDDYLNILKKLINTRKYISKKIHYIHIKYKQSNMTKAVKRIISEIGKHPEKVFRLINKSKRLKVEFVSKVENKQINLLFGKEMIEEIQNNWTNIFSSKVPPNDLSAFLEHMPSIPANKEIQPDFSVKNLVKIVNSKINTAPGPSESSWNSLKNSHVAVLSTLSQLYLYIYENSYIPVSWKEGNTILLEKPTKDIGLDKFRPITLLSVEYKLYSHVLNEAFVKNLDKYKIIPISQNGFFPNRGSDQCLHTLISIIADSKFKNIPLFCLFIDFAKAFDSVEHWVIKSVLSHCNFGKLGDAILSTLHGSLTKIETASGWTEFIEFLRGTKQGDILSPSIFIFLIAPLLWTLQSKDWGYFMVDKRIPGLALADDIVLMASSVSNIDKIYKLTEEYAKLVGLNIKPSKSAAAYRGTKSYIPSVNGILFEDLGSSKSYTYLGVHINLDLDWKDQMEASEYQFKSSIELILRKYYIPCSLHIKLINAVATAALAYRMQFILFDDSWLENLTKWLINKISSAHSYQFNSSPYYWCSFLNLVDLVALNRAAYLSSLIKNLNKPELIAFESLNLVFKAYLHEPSLDPKKLPHPFLIKVNKILSQYSLNIVNVALLREIKQACIVNPKVVTILGKLIHFNAPVEILNTNNHLPSIPHNLIYPDLKVCHIFTDGSCNPLRGIMRGGVIAPDIPFESVFEVHGFISSTEAELNSIELAIKFSERYKRLYIFTDSLPAINLILGFDSLNTNGILKVTCRAVLRRIRSYINKFQILISNEWPPKVDTNITLYHFHSHMGENARKFLNHSQLHMENLKDLFPKVLKYNDQVDTLVEIGVKVLPKNYPTILLPGNDDWQLYDVVLSQPVYTGVRKLIYKLEMESKLKALKISKPAFSSRLLHPEVSSKLTTHFLRSPDVNLRKISDFIHKILDKSLPTKKRVHNNISANSYVPPSNALKKRKLEVNYENPFCNSCLKLDLKEVIEDTEHIFSLCPHNLEIYNAVALEILEEINKFILPARVDTFPFWFTNSLTVHIPLNEIENRLLIFPKILGDIGYIPVALKDWFLLNKFSKKVWKGLLENIIYKFQTSVHKKWLSRCDRMFENKFPHIA